MPIDKTEEAQRKIFSKNLSFLIRASGKSQKEIADELELSKSAISNWIHLTSFPQYSTITKLADYFGVTTADLVNQRDNITDDPIFAARLVSDPELMEIMSYISVLPPKIRQSFLTLAKELHESYSRE